MPRAVFKVDNFTNKPAGHAHEHLKKFSFFIQYFDKITLKISVRTLNSI